MESLSLYDQLVGGFLSSGDDPSTSQDRLQHLTEVEKLRRSIIENLRMVLQTPRGSVRHLPDFGMPSIAKIYYDSDRSLDPLRAELRNLILKYEPRIAEVRIPEPEFDESRMHLLLRIYVSIKDVQQGEFLITEFSTTGWTKVEFERDRV